MTDFVLCTGSWQGAWCWRRTGIPNSLRQAGHDVYTPTYTGLGDRVHLAHPDIDLNTHIMDIVNTIVFEDIHDVVLVGWSYAGMVITGVAEHVPDRMNHLIYLDAYVPKDGQSIVDIQSQEIIKQAEEAASVYGDGWKLPPSPGGDSRMSPHPLKTCYTPVEINNPAAAALPRTYIYYTEDKQNNEFLSFTNQGAEIARATSNWNYYEIGADHSLGTEDNIRQLVNILLEIG